jgi:hypothetical protein
MHPQASPVHSSHNSAYAAHMRLRPRLRFPVSRLTLVFETLFRPLRLQSPPVRVLSRNSLPEYWPRSSTAATAPAAPQRYCDAGHRVQRQLHPQHAPGLSCYVPHFSPCEHAGDKTQRRATAHASE